ncbi:unnamed protein product [Knipowitschia caucasica]|uniref:PH and SEC7 domain-containing protein 4-like n=1 Tax=Knipowitschia caucasica TaxID=637954 RepID=A0AAV2IW97_KNICA
MEEEDLCSSRPRQDPSAERQYLNGQAGGVVAEERGAGEGESADSDKETWEQIVWPVCTAAVDWAGTRTSATASPLVTDGVSSNQLDSDPVTQALKASFPIRSESLSSDLCKEAEEQDEFDSWLLLCSEPEWMGPNLKPCDSESTEEDHRQFDHFGTSLSSRVPGEKHRPSVEPDFFHSCVEIQFAGFIEDDIEHLRLVESPNDADVLLSGQNGLEEVPALVNSDKISGREKDTAKILPEDETTAASQRSAGVRREEADFSIDPDQLTELEQLLEDLSRFEETRQYHSQPVCEEEAAEADPDPAMCRRAVGVQREEEEEHAQDPEPSENSLDVFHLQEDCTAPSQNAASLRIQDEPRTTERVQSSSECHRSPEEVHPGVQVTETTVYKVEEEEEEEEDGGEQYRGSTVETAQTNGDLDRDRARVLAQRLFKLDDIQRKDVVKYLDKDNSFSRAVGEEYLKHFDFRGQTLDEALRSFLSVVVLIGESQERERVLNHFSNRYHCCNQGCFHCSGCVLALTCAVMLLNTDLHGQLVGKSMSSSKFVSNLDGMNEGENFNKDLLKSLYNSIKTEPLPWAVAEEEMSSVLLEEEREDPAPLRSKANPFLDVPIDKNAVVIKEGFLQRKIHADADGKRTPWGKRGWKMFNVVLRGMVLYFHKDEYRREVSEELLSLHHSLAKEAEEYTKRPHVFRLQTADWRVFLFQASSRAEMSSWMNRVNLLSALHSAPPFPAAVGSQRRFCRPILPAAQSANTLERQLQSHSGMLQSFRADLSQLQENPPEGRRAKTKELEEHRLRAEYLQYEVCRYEAFVRVLQVWSRTRTSADGTFVPTDLNRFDRDLCPEAENEEEEEGGMKKSHSSPSLEMDAANAPPPVKVKRNISERRTYRRVVVPKWNKED